MCLQHVRLQSDLHIVLGGALSLLYMYMSELDMGPFFQTQSNPIHELYGSNPIQFGNSQFTSNPIHKYLVLNRIRKLRATNYSNADL